MFCKHDWKILSDTVTKSKYECSIEALRGSGANNIKLPWQLSCADRKVIQIVCCTKCGKLKRFVENI